MNSSVGLYQDDCGFRFDNSYSKLPASLFVHQVPQHFKNPSLVIFNECLAGALGLNVDALKAANWSFFSGRQLPENSSPIAQAYAGHQFGHFARLGDGRAILLGEHIAPNQARFDIPKHHLKATPYVVC